MWQQRLSLLQVTTALSLVLTGCTDSTAPPDPIRATASAARNANQLRDGAINPGDTHFSATLSSRTYVEDPEQMPAPVGVASMSDVSSQVYQDYEERYVEGGYRADGQIVFGVYWDDAVKSPEIGSVRASADQITTYDQWGSVLSSEYFNSYMAGAGLPGGTLVDGFFDDGSGGGCDPTAVVCDPAQPLSTEGATVTTAENGEWREIRTVFSPAASGDFTAAKGGAGEIETVRRYRRMAAASAGSTGKPGWRLEQIRQVVREDTDAGLRVTRSETNIQYHRWHRNAGKDATRREAAARRPQPAAQAKPQSSPRQARTATSEPGSMDSGSVGTSSIDICGRGSDRVNHVVVPGGTPVIWQHGICSDAGTWDGMRPRVSSVLAVGHERAFSTSTLKRLDEQTTELEMEVNFTGSSRNIVVGHSQGGLIARRFAQRRNDLVHGVITMGTPHQGALVADVGPDLVSDYVGDAVAGDCFGSFMCDIVVQILARRAAGEITYGVKGTLVPVIHDVRTNSDFVNQLNSTYEPFLRASIEVDAGNRWALMRIIGDANTHRGRLLNGGRPDGQAYVRTTEGVYRAGIFLQDLAMFLTWQAYPYGGGVGCDYSGYRTYWPPCYDGYYGNYWHTSSYWTTLASILFNIGNFVTSTLDRIDSTWNYITNRNSERSDGFVQFSSQQYPSGPGAHAPARFIIRPPDADSHTGETASPASLLRIKDAMLFMGVAPR